MNDIIFFKSGSHRATEKIKRIKIPHISLWSMTYGGTAGTSIMMCLANDFEKIKSIKGVSKLKSLPKGEWGSRNENKALGIVFQEHKIGANLKQNVNAAINKQKKVSRRSGAVVSGSDLSMLESELAKLDVELEAVEAKRNVIFEKIAKLKASTIIGDIDKSASFMPWQKNLTNEEIGFIIGSMNRYGVAGKITDENWTSVKFDAIKNVLLEIKEHHSSNLSELGGKLLAGLYYKFNV